VDVNRAFCERYGINKEQVRGHNMSELGMGLFDEDRMRLANQLREHRSVRNMILSGRHRNGKLRQSLVNAEMVDFDGELRVLISSMDVTDMLQAEVANTARIQAEADSQAKGLMLVRIAEEKAASDRLRMLADEARSNLQQLRNWVAR
jgi:PAS domain S-box-containing protein